MGGTIRAGNRPDRTGAVFTIEMPVPDGEEPASASDTSTAEIG
jgi:hypothetical protein